MSLTNSFILLVLIMLTFVLAKDSPKKEKQDAGNNGLPKYDKSQEITKDHAKKNERHLPPVKETEAEKVKKPKKLEKEVKIRQFHPLKEGGGRFTSYGVMNYSPFRNSFPQLQMQPCPDDLILQPSHCTMCHSSTNIFQLWYESGPCIRMIECPQGQVFGHTCQCQPIEEAYSLGKHSDKCSAPDVHPLIEDDFECNTLENPDVKVKRVISDNLNLCYLPRRHVKIRHCPKTFRRLRAIRFLMTNDTIIFEPSRFLEVDGGFSDIKRYECVHIQSKRRCTDELCQDGSCSGDQYYEKFFRATGLTACHCSHKPGQGRIYTTILSEKKEVICRGMILTEVEYEIPERQSRSKRDALEPVSCPECSLVCHKYGIVYNSPAKVIDRISACKVGGCAADEVKHNTAVLRFSPQMMATSSLVKVYVTFYGESDQLIAETTCTDLDSCDAYTSWFSFVLLFHLECWWFGPKWLQGVTSIVGIIISIFVFVSVGALVTNMLHAVEQSRALATYPVRILWMSILYVFRVLFWPFILFGKSVFWLCHGVYRLVTTRVEAYRNNRATRENRSPSNRTTSTPRATLPRSQDHDVERNDHFSSSDEEEHVYDEIPEVKVRPRAGHHLVLSIIVVLCLITGTCADTTYTHTIPISDCEYKDGKVVNCKVSFDNMIGLSPVGQTTTFQIRSSDDKPVGHLFFQTQYMYNVGILKTLYFTGVLTPACTGEWHCDGHGSGEASCSESTCAGFAGKDKDWCHSTKKSYSECNEIQEPDQGSCPHFFYAYSCTFMCHMYNSNQLIRVTKPVEWNVRLAVKIWTDMSELSTIASTEKNGVSYDLGYGHQFKVFDNDDALIILDGAFQPDVPKLDTQCIVQNSYANIGTTDYKSALVPCNDIGSYTTGVIGEWQCFEYYDAVEVSKKCQMRDKLSYTQGVKGATHCIGTSLNTTTVVFDNLLPRRVGNHLVSELQWDSDAHAVQSITSRSDVGTWAKIRLTLTSLKIVPAFSKFRCTASVTNTTGCYDCDEGVIVKMDIEAFDGAGIAYFQCPTINIENPISVETGKASYETGFGYGLQSIDIQCKLICPLNVIDNLRVLASLSHPTPTDPNDIVVTWPIVENPDGTWSLDLSKLPEFFASLFSGLGKAIGNLFSSIFFDHPIVLIIIGAILILIVIGIVMYYGRFLSMALGVFRRLKND